MKILLIVPENSYRIKEFLDAATELHLDTYIATDSTFAPPDTADRVFDSLEFCNPDIAGASINAIVETLGIDTVVAIDEGGVEIIEWSRALAKGLQKPTKSALALRDKGLLREILSDVVAQPKLFESTDPLDFATQKYVVKPCKGSASIGVVKASSRQELDDAIKFIESTLINFGHAIIEEYIDGNEYAFEGVVVNGSLVELALFDKPHPLSGPYFAETIYVTPSSLPENLKKKLFQTVEAAVKRLGVESGPVHVELRITREETVYIIDFANRSIGGRCSTALNFVGDRTLEVVLLEALTEGDASHVRRENQFSGVYMISPTSDGTLQSIAGIDEARRVPFVTEVVIDAKLGHRYNALPAESSYLGFIYAKAPTRTLCIEALEKSYDLLNFSFVEKQEGISTQRLASH